MTEITYGTENVFNSAITEHIDVAVLDETRFVVAYEDTASNDGFCVIGSISGDTITFGTPVAFQTTCISSSVSVAALDSTHFVVAWNHCGGTYRGTARIGVVSGTSITSYGTENDFETNYTNRISFAALDSTHFVVAYQDFTDNNGEARIGSVSGSTITYGATNIFNSVTTHDISVAALDSTHFVVTYQDEGGDDYGIARVGLVSGTTISSYGAENIFRSNITNQTSVAVLDSTHFVVAYEADGWDGECVVGLVSGTTISSYGDSKEFKSGTLYDISITAFDNLYFVVSYCDRYGVAYGTSMIGEVDGTSIVEYGSEHNFNAVRTMFIANAAFNDTHFVVAYQDDGGSDYGCARIGSFPVQFTPQVIIS